MSKCLLADVIEVLAVFRAVVYRRHLLETSTMQGVLRWGPRSQAGTYATMDLTSI